jgi:hypothetical protein
MPKPVARRSGCKVSWVYYASKAEADAASVIAAHNREIQINQGYDFGYCWPGSVKGPMPADSKYEGLYEVCIA